MMTWMKHFMAKLFPWMVCFCLCDGHRISQYVLSPPKSMTKKNVMKGTFEDITDTRPEHKRSKSWYFSHTGTLQLYNSQGKEMAVKNGIQNNNILQDINELEIIKKLGSGVCGTVKLAKHLPTNEMLAVKFIDFTQQINRKQFQDEMKIFLEIQHPHIVQFKGVCLDSSSSYVHLFFFPLPFSPYKL